MLKLTESAIGMLTSKYRAVLKNMRLKGAALFFTGCLLVPSPAMAAETVDFPGTPLQTYRGFLDNSLAPSGSDTGKSISLSGNIINVYNTFDQFGKVIEGFVLGAVNLLDSDIVTNNKVFFHDGTLGFGMNILGGVAENSFGSVTVRDNSVTVSGGTVQGAVVGGVADVVGVDTSFTATATNNSVTISDGTVDTVFGGQALNNAGTATATDNRVTISGNAIISDIIYGGTAETLVGTATTTSNIVTIDGGTVSYHVLGGYASSFSSGITTTTGNNVTISGGTIGGTVGDMLVGGYADSYSGTATATGNSVTISGGTISSSYILGGHTYSSSFGITSATGNSVTISGGTIGGTVGDMIIGGNAESGSLTAIAENNSVTISGGTVDSIIYGGNADSVSGVAVATDNNVTISGGTIKDNVYGGNADSGSGIAIAVNNTVTIKGSPTFVNTTLYGGRADNGLGTSADNTLNLYSAGLSVNGLYDFQNLNFYLPTTLETGETMLYIANEADITDVAVNVGIAGGSSPLKEGDGIILIDAGTLTGEPENNNADGRGMHGVTLRYEFDIEKQDNQLLATVTKVGANDQAKALLEGKLAGTLSVLRGQDMIIDQAIPSAMQAAGGQKTDTFAAVGYGNYRYETGSHIDSNGWSLVAGFAKERPDNDGGKLTHGFFFEGGRGSYDTFNSFASGDVRGNGNTKYYGVGALLRKNGKSDGKGYNYHEGSLRLGRVTTDFSAIISGVASGYDNGVPYYGAHYGFGRVANKNNGATLDIYGKLLYTHQGGSNLALTSGDPMEFSSVNSIRARMGTLYTTAPAKSGTTTYYGLAYEYEFNGKQNASTNGFGIDAPSLKGGSLIGTIGLNHKQSADSNFSLGLNLSGYAGKRQGVGVNAQFKWAF